VHESGTLLSAPVELAIYNLLTSPAAKQYVLQTANELGTLGQSRGKINLLRRFDLYNLSSSYEDSIPGTHFSPSKSSALTTPALAPTTPALAATNKIRR
jgi:hypothetical protein